MESKVFIIGEIGINHNGDLEICKQLIDLAKDSGCDAVKFQKRDIDSVYKNDFLDSYRESPWGSTQREQKKGLEFGLDEYNEIAKYCKEKDIEWFASAWDLESQKFLKNFDLKYNKVASAMIVDLGLLDEIASEGKYTFISTGMTTYKEIDKAVDIFNKYSCEFELMHTVSTYPMQNSDANLKLIKTLSNRYNCRVGYSGHETGIAISCAAVALGATSIERHITLDRSMYGSDQAASLEPAGIRQLVGAIRNIETAFGDGIKRFLDVEKPVAENLRQHINF